MKKDFVNITRHVIINVLRKCTKNIARFASIPYAPGYGIIMCIKKMLCCMN